MSLDPDEASARPAGSREWLNIPNRITIARLAISAVLFAVLILNNYDLLGNRSTWLNVALGLFILAAITDFLDGYLARKWNMVSTFGRIADPIADKVFICGAFVLLIKTSRLVDPWIAVVILTREFLISGLRSYLESSGVAFPAASGGKLKMLFQSITIPVLLFYEANVPESDFFMWLGICLLALTILLTITSSIQYLFQAIGLLKQRDPPKTG